MDLAAFSHRVGDLLRRLSHPARLAVVGLIGAAITYGMYEAIYVALPLGDNRATVSWTMAAAIGAFTQHHLHRRITFERKDRHYGASLWRAVIVEAVVIAVAAGLNFWLTERLGVAHRLAWLASQVTLFTTKYVAVRFFVFRSSRAVEATPERQADAGRA